MKKGLSVLTILFWGFVFNATSSRNNLFESLNNTNTSIASDIYKKLKSQELSFEAFKCALNGFAKLQNNKLLYNDSLLTIIDYSLPSTKQRLFVIDIKNKKILTESLVAHGKSTGELYPESFSNILQSHQSSLGFYITEHTYEGKHGYSLRLNGIEKDINDRAMERSIVIHGADYVSKSYIDKFGRIGRSFGCPALPIEQNKQIIDLIKNNSCLFIYFPASDYMKKSKLVISDQYSQITVE